MPPLPRRTALAFCVTSVFALRTATAQPRLPRDVLAYRPAHANENTPLPIPALTGVRQVVIGDNHACALMTSGSVACWGGNHYGQLGDGSTSSHVAPVPVSGLSGIAQLAAGNDHTCARTTAGTVFCWGSNAYGQITLDAARTPVTIPHALPGLTNVIDLSSSGESVCVVLSNGTARCWGANFAGQLGDGTRVNRVIPVMVAGLANAVQLSVGGNAACARTTNGAVWCWGANDRGQLGIGADVEQNSPSRVTIASGATDLAVGDYFACARLQGGALSCWGEVGTTAGHGYAPTPVAIPVARGVDAVAPGALAAGGARGCARGAGGTAMCWNTEIAASQRPAVTNVAGLQDVASIAVRGPVSCAVLTSGRVSCWGPASIAINVPMPSPR